MSKLDDLDYTVTVRSLREISEIGENVLTDMRIQLSDKAKQQIKDLIWQGIDRYTYRKKLSLEEKAELVKAFGINDL